MRVGLWGNFAVPWTTETHLALSLESLGHDVRRLQEGEVRATQLATHIKESEADVLLWVQTFGLAGTGGTREERASAVEAVRGLGVPTVSYHLDRWWGLNREAQAREEPFFRTDLVVTADGGHDDAFADAGVNHRWLPPGVYHGEAHDGRPARGMRSDVAFVGSWKSYGHPEWEPTRLELIRRLREWYPGRFSCWPQGSRAVRGEALNSLYASAKVVVGDSCLAGRATHYWSDRVPETLGRGGFLVHPWVEGMEGHFELGVHFGTYPLGDWGALHETVDFWLGEAAERERVRRAGAEHVRRTQTYADRMTTVLGWVDDL